MDAREKTARLDLIAFQLGEIEKAVPKPGEDEARRAAHEFLERGSVASLRSLHQIGLGVEHKSLQDKTTSDKAARAEIGGFS